MKLFAITAFHHGVRKYRREDEAAEDTSRHWAVQLIPSTLRTTRKHIPRAYPDAWLVF